MRIDGREIDQLREIDIQTGFTDYAEGSVLISFGQTSVLCNATIENKVPHWITNQGKGHGWVTAEYAMLPRSTHTRTPRETIVPRGRSMEIQRLIGRSLRAGVDLDALEGRTCIVDCDVLQADGGTRTAAITGGFLALALAIKKLAASSEIPNTTILTEIAAISLGMVKNTIMLDLNYEEDRRADVDANIVMNGNGKYIEVQCSSEGDPIARTEFDKLLDLANIGITELLAIQKEFLKNN